MAHVVALAAVVAAAVLAYANAPAPAFLFDARVLIGENPVLRTANAGTVGYLLTHDYWQPMATDGLYRPVTMLSFLIDHAVLGHADRATGYVVENVVLHCICAGFVYALVWTLAHRRWPAVAAALLFAVHPVTTEAVANVVGRADLLAATGVLAGLLCWAHGARASGARRAAFAVGLGLAAVLAFFSKESGLVLAGAVLLWDVAFPPAGGRRLRAEHVVVATVLVAYLTARWYVAASGLPPEDVAPIDNPLVEAPFWLGRLTAVGVLVRELALVVWPATLSIDYSYRQIPIVAWPPAETGDWAAFAGVAALGLAFLGLVRARRTAPAIFFLGAFAGLALLPSSNLLRLIGSIMAERFLYLPLAGIAGMAALAADGWARTRARRALASGVVAASVLALGVRTVARNQDWQDERRLWAETVRAAPESAKARKGYARALFDPHAEAQALAQVVAQGEQAVAIRPDYQQALVDLGSYYLTVGDVVAKETPAASSQWYERAVTTLEKARALDEKATARSVEKMRAHGVPDSAMPDVGDGILYNNLALAYVRLQRLSDALGAYRRMRELSPTSAGLYRDIATLENALGQTDDAAVALWQAVDIADDADAKQRLAEIYRGTPAGDTPIVTDGPAGDVQLHTVHPVVRRHRCRAWRELDAIFTRARLPGLAERARFEAASCAGD